MPNRDGTGPKGNGQTGWRNGICRRRPTALEELRVRKRIAEEELKELSRRIEELNK